MRVGRAQPGHWNFCGVSARNQVANHMIGFDRLARLNVAEHRCRERRTFRGEHRCRAFQRRRAGRIALRGRDRPAATGASGAGLKTACITKVFPTRSHTVKRQETRDKKLEVGSPDLAQCHTPSRRRSPLRNHNQQRNRCRKRRR